jgi:hypothetical protein
MSQLHKFFLAAVIGSASLAACAQTPQPTEADHAQHHPQGAASAPVTAQPAVHPSGVKPARPAMSPEQMGAMDKHMKAMQETHQKMMSAKTPEERQAAMAEHMKLMHGSGGMPMMSMMGGDAKGMQCDMGGDAKGMACGMGGNAKGMQCGMMGGNNTMMEQRMAHMESMMQTMMERLPAAPAKPKPAR